MSKPRGPERVPKTSRLRNVPSDARPMVAPKATSNVSARALLTRHRIFRVVALFGIVGIASVIGTPSTRQQEGSSEHREVSPNEIVLGNIRFYLQTPLPESQKQELFLTMQKAYTGLADYFGIDLMTSDQRFDFPIIIENGFEQGVVSWNTTMEINKDGQLEIIGAPTPLHLKLSGISEDIIAHELFHLFLQAPVVWSEAFHEGHPYVLQNILYPKQMAQESTEHLLTIPELDTVLNIPLDFTFYDQRERKKGIQQNSFLHRLVLNKFQNEWGRFMKLDPGFLKKFYREVAQQKKKGKVSFTRDELMVIASASSDLFDDFYKHTPALHEIGEEPNVLPVLKAIKDPQNRTVLVINLRPVGRKVIGNKMIGHQMTPPFFTSVLKGAFKITFFDPNDQQPKTYWPHLDSEIFGGAKIAELGGTGMDNPSLKIFIGETEVPFAN